MGRTDFLVATPSFLTGAGRTLDLGAHLERWSYNFSASPQEADRWAIEQDWWAVGCDLRKAVADAKVELIAR